MVKTFLIPLFKDVKDFTLDLLFPKRCLICGKEGEILCAICKSKLTNDETQVCINCRLPSILGLTHPKCFTPQSPDGLFTFYNYHDSNVAKVLISGKYYFLPEVYTILAKEISEQLKNNFKNFLDNAILAPVPLHPQRLRWRGFNQAEVLSKTIAENLGLPTENFLLRSKPTKTQKDLSQQQRLTNVQGVFKIGKESPKGKTIFLVDDVVTTGATLREAAKILKRSGASKVYCLAVARD